MKHLYLRLLPAVAALPLGACASSGDYPSLAIRDVERITGVAEPVAAKPAKPEATAPAGPSAGLSAQITQLVDQAKSAHDTFSGKQGRTTQLVAAGAGAPAGSESWALANLALSELEASRSQAMISLAGLDKLYADERLANYNEESGDAVAIAASRDQILGWIAEENTTLAAMRDRLGD